MPRVYLSAEARVAAQEARELDKLSELVRTCKGRTRRNDEDTAKEAGMSRQHIQPGQKPGGGWGDVLAGRPPPGSRRGLHPGGLAADRRL